MGDENQPSKKRAAGRELSRDITGLDDDEEVGDEEMGTFKKANEDVLATRRIVKVRRQQTSAPSAPSSNPFAGIQLVPPAAPAPAPAPAAAPAEAEAVEDKAGSEDVDTKDDANSEVEVKKVDPEEKPSDVTTESDAVLVNEVPPEQAPVVSQSDQAVIDTTEEVSETKPIDDGSAEKTEGETADDKGDKNENEKTDAIESGGVPLSSFHQLSNSRNAFTGLSGTGFSTSFSQSSLPAANFDTPANGNSFTFGSVMANTSIGTKTESTSLFLHEVSTETGEENEDTVFNADSALFEFLDGGWKERGKGEVKLNVLKGEIQKARLVMRTKGNLRLILNASLFPDMKLTKMEKKGITFACVNSASEGKDGLSTFALKFKDSSIMEEFYSTVSAHKDKPANSTALKTPENSPKASDD